MYFPGAEISYSREQKPMEVPRLFGAPDPGRKVLGGFLNTLSYPVLFGLPCLNLVVVPHFSLTYSTCSPGLQASTLELNQDSPFVPVVLDDDWTLEFYFGQKVAPPFLTNPNHSKMTSGLPSCLFSHIQNQPLPL